MLMYTELVSLLKHSALCADWPQEARVALADKCSIRSVKKETPLFSQGQPATHFYLLANGQVSMGLRTQTGSEREVYQLQGPASFGEVYMLMQNNYPLDAHAVTDCDLVVVRFSIFVWVVCKRADAREKEIGRTS